MPLTGQQVLLIDHLGAPDHLLQHLVESRQVTQVGWSLRKDMGLQEGTVAIHRHSETEGKENTPEQEMSPSVLTDGIGLIQKVRNLKYLRVHQVISSLSLTLTFQDLQRLQKRYHLTYLHTHIFMCHVACDPCFSYPALRSTLQWQRRCQQQV